MIQLMRKILLFIICIFSSLNLFSQWVEIDSVSIKATIIVENENWIYVLPDGTEIYCGLPNDDLGSSYIYYKINYRSDLLYCKRTNLIDSSFSVGFFKLDIDENENLCWKEDIYWIFFDKNNNLMNQVFYNAGHVVKPKEFKAVLK